MLSLPCDPEEGAEHSSERFMWHYLSEDGILQIIRSLEEKVFREGRQMYFICLSASLGIAIVAGVYVGIPI